MGPFYAPDQPDLGNGTDMIKENDGERIVVQGQITSVNGGPLQGATVEVWQNAPNGLYTVQDPDQPEDNLRSILHTDDNGNYSFSTIKPAPYTVPDDGAGGELLRAAGRHSWRPAHNHGMISADGHKRHVSQNFNENAPYIDEDAVFGVRGDLVTNYDGEPAGEDLQRYTHIERPFNAVNMDFVLARAD